jgi:hypothetical protein
MPRKIKGIEGSRKDFRAERDYKYQAYKDIVGDVLKVNDFSPKIVKIAENINKLTNQASPTKNSNVPDKTKFLFMIYQSAGISGGFDNFKKSLECQDAPKEEGLLFCRLLSE